MRAEAGVDERELLRLWIEYRQLTLVVVDRECFGVRIIRALPAECRRAGGVVGPGHPDSAAAVEHRIVIVEFAVPDLLNPPIGRSCHRFFNRRMTGPERLRHIRALRRPVNAYGKLYGSPEYATDHLPVLDPKTGEVTYITDPTPNGHRLARTRMHARARNH